MVRSPARSVLIVIVKVLSLLLVMSVYSVSAKVQEQDSSWCVANGQQSDAVLQSALDWACGLGQADCTAIQPGMPCYLPNTVKDHASYAFNSYYQKFKSQGASCDFNGAGILTQSDPSHDSCKFDSNP
ncbi:hypothetical protein LUZ62_052189 [Rhynchospora pubera]|uniref:X8 domain-containing protein n=1 Tax=Rhynchospora pubera TaxID=906938 RepID=A0AAV8GDI7_9POAL|nr:hypothetical protein LUZ62_052189 [Rhynchospora pubera]